ncbi:hypothetical protein ACFY36_35670 [Actinoplanes sp. NPDC000266]
MTLPEELVEALGLTAREDGVPLSRLVANAAERTIPSFSSARQIWLTCCLG